MKQQIADILMEVLKEKNISLSNEQIINLIETPPSSELGDFAFPCFVLSKQLKQPPQKIALDLKNDLTGKSKIFSLVRVDGAYINFFIDRKKFVEDLVKKVMKKKENFGKQNVGKGKKVVIDMSSPNIAKPFGIGHLRSTIIGNSIANISKGLGYKVIKINHIGDWGTQFGKLIFGYKKFGSGKKLKEDAISHLLEIYVKVNENPDFDEESRIWFKKLEDGDREATRLWKKFKELSLGEFSKIYDFLGVKFDSFKGEAFYNNKMEDIVKELKQKKIAEMNDGALVVNLKEYGLGVALIKKSDEATLYITRDLAAAIYRYKKYKFAKMIYEVGSEQKLHFEQLFKILDLMGYKWYSSCVHVEHGLYLDKDGKKFSTRKGKTVFMEEIIEKTKNLVKEELKKRTKLTEKELREKVSKISKAAIIYADLKNYRGNNIVFDEKRIINFEGDTGPYLLYSYARAKSIIKKSRGKKSGIFSKGKISQGEFDLVKKISLFPETVTRAYENLNPALIANYSFQLAQTFNEFYHSTKVLNSEDENFLLALVESFCYVLKSSLSLLGIESIEKM
ncbi:MAG TPA: arginine--tRNA ligase [Candidatus Nanoarchaeia archaeon]|nr:arginine--tRNA ligase [Candidatus Nanoarchaeia archaeon]